MKCKCCKCYKEIAENEQVKENHAVWCQDCHQRNRIYGWIGVGVSLTFIVLFLFYTLWQTKKKR